MPDYGPHAAFILASYLVVTIVLAATIAWLIIDGRTKARDLAQVDARRKTSAPHR